jgi:hypothetical protein
MFTVSLSPTTLTHAEASGITSGRLGMSPERRSRVPANWPSPVLRFLAPAATPNAKSNLMSRQTRPAPSSHRAAPVRPNRPPMTAA